jgi:TRAP-type mannitol/chloroaromatic compound transport system substrate-binding protein
MVEAAFSKITRKEGKMKKGLILGFLFSVAFSLLLTSRPIDAAAQTITWRVSTPFAPRGWPQNVADMWAEDVMKMSGDRIKIEFDLGSALSLPFDVFGSVAKGFHDAGYTSPVLEIQKYPAARLFSILPAFTDLLGYYTWMYAYGGKEALQELYGNTVKVLPAGMNWARSGGWGNRTFEKLSDFKGTKQATSNDPWKNILSEAGASVEAVPFRFGARRVGDGTLDAMESAFLPWGVTPWQDMMFGIQKYAKYCYFPGLQRSGGFFVLLVNNEKWNALPPDLKEIMRGACDAAMAQSLAKWIMDDVNSIKMLKEQGKTALFKFPSEMQQEILDKYVAQYDAIQDPLFQKIWKSQQEFLKAYVPYMKFQQVDAEVKLK